MARFFNTAGPRNPKDHYMLPPERRLPGVRPLIDEKAYFVVHALRQSGKTTCFQFLAASLTAEQAVRHKAPDLATTVTAAHVEAAKEALILRRDTHLDSLVNRLREPRVRRVLEPIVAAEFPEGEIPEDDIEFVKDLGLVVRGPGGLEIANPIYREIIPTAWPRSKGSWSTVAATHRR